MITSTDTPAERISSPQGAIDAAVCLITVSSFLGLLFALLQFFIVKRTNIKLDAKVAAEKDSLVQYTESGNEIMGSGQVHEESTEEKLKTISEAIQLGAHSFLKAEYTICAIFIVVFGLFLFILLGAPKTCGNLGNEACWDDAGFALISFLIGAATSTVSGFVGMSIAVYTNVRTSVAATRGWTDAFNTAFRGGAVMGFALTSIALVVLLIVIACFKAYYGNDSQYLYEAVSGYGLGGSCIALFGRVGGGIFTKAADVGADLVGKVEKDIPEDDPRNPATIADNVGDNVGDIAGMGSDLFGSFAESTCAALVLSTASLVPFSYSTELFPLVISAIGILCCIITSFIATNIAPVRTGEQVEKVLKVQLIASTVILTPILCVVSYLFLPDYFVIGVPPLDTQGRWWGVFICLLCGLWSGLIIGLTTEYYTSHSYKPVREVAASSETGAATLVIYGLALGYKSAIIPIFLLAITIFTSFYLVGLYGVAIAALGMLSSLSIGLTIDAYGPITDNAGGIAEMAEMGPEIRNITDTLDAAGNTTAAIGKGFAIGSAALVSLALFGAFMTRTAQKLSIKNCQVPEKYPVILNILSPLVFAFLVIGAMIPYWFSALTMKSVGIAAKAMVEEVRRQFHEIPGIMERTAKPDYEKCIVISTRASLREMIAPGALVILSPILTGYLFGVYALGGLLAGSLASSVQMAISMSNTGGAWDNAKKYIESGQHGGKGSDCHKAAVTGDTVGDPLKDTSGPALNIVMKLMAILSLVFADSFVSLAAPSDQSWAAYPNSTFMCL